MKTSIKCVMDDLEIERIAKKLKAELQKLSDTAFSIETNGSEPNYKTSKADKYENNSKVECVSSLVALKMKYQEFAADPTRISSMKQMAAKFSLELDAIIKSAIRRKK